jgi:RES domain-containing protein
VPSVITPGEWNYLLNPAHPGFSLDWVVSGPTAYTFDARLLDVPGAGH